MEPNPPSTPPASPPPPPIHATRPAPSDTSAKLVYVLYLLSATLALSFASLVGVVIAYVNVGDAPEPLRSHFRFQIRTFWLGLLYGLVNLLLVLVGAGLFLWIFIAAWLVVRCVKGLKSLDRGEPYANPTTWLW